MLTTERTDDDAARYQCAGSPTLYTLAQMVDANADTPDVVDAIRALAPGETASFGGGAWADSWVKRVR